MRSRALGRIARAAELTCWLSGAALTGWYLLARADGTIIGSTDLEAFVHQLPAPDQSLWARSRIREYAAALGVHSEAPVAVLKIPAIKLQVPVYPDSSELSLNRGAGLIDGMSLPEEGGNLGISGHRDGFFRVLKDVHKGDVIEVQTRLAVHRYRITSVEIVDAADAHLLKETEDPTVTLVTCYPFYYVGHAPQRFIVHGEIEWPAQSAASHQHGE